MSPTRYLPSLSSSENPIDYVQPTPVNDTGTINREKRKEIINCEYSDAGGGSPDMMYYRQTPTSSPRRSSGLERCL